MWFSLLIELADKTALHVVLPLDYTHQIAFIYFINNKSLSSNESASLS